MKKDITLKELSEALTKLLEEYPEAASCTVGVKYDYGYGTACIAAPLTFDDEDIKDGTICFEGTT